MKRLVQRLGLALLVIALCSATWRSPAAAQGLAYDELIRQAIVEFDASHWEEARVLFRRAHTENPSARTWRGMGITAFELRRYVDAVAELEAALADPRKPLTEQQRTEVQQLIQRAREFISVYRVRVRPSTAEVRVDGAVAHQSDDGQIFLDPGRHVLTVRAPGYAERRAELSVDAGERDEVAVELEVAGGHDEPEPAIAAGRAARAEPGGLADEGAPAARRRFAGPVTWSLLGATLIALPTAVSLRLMAGQLSDKVGSTTCEADDSQCDANVRDWRQRGQREELAANVLFAASGALFAGTLLSFVLERRAEPPRTAISVGLHQVSVAHHF